MRKMNCAAFLALLTISMIGRLACAQNPPTLFVVPSKATAGKQGKRFRCQRCSISEVGNHFARIFSKIASATCLTYCRSARYSHSLFAELAPDPPSNPANSSSQRFFLYSRHARSALFSRSNSFTLSADSVPDGASSSARMPRTAARNVFKCFSVNSTSFPVHCS
jgi:hypothetical protein